MRKIVVFILTVFLLSLFSGNVLAQGLPSLPDVQKEVDNTRPKGTVTNPAELRRATSKDKLDEARKKAEERREELKDKANAKREQVKKKVAETRREALKRLTSKTIERLTTAVERMEKLSGRLQEHINKFAQKGSDTSKAQIQLDEATAKLAEAKGAISALQGTQDDLVSSEDPKTYFAGLKDEIKNIKQMLVEAHRLLGSSMGEIKGLSSARGGENEQE